MKFEKIRTGRVLFEIIETIFFFDNLKFLEYDGFHVTWNHGYYKIQITSSHW
jgi:hypothetical protein